ncbi:MAG: RHS repeat-associated core domain-containing protein, partial [bacterium]|nr:RHS repeat-associated core domain-containing protein [bacterium]
YAYDGSGNVWAMGDDRFQYDLLGRLTESNVHGWEQDFVYDAFGNITRVETTPPGGSQDDMDIAVTVATNRLADHVYDGSGNLTELTGVWTQVYDPLNMAILRNPAADASQWAAIYTAADERLATWNLSSGEVQQHWTLRSPSGQILRDFHYGPSGIGELIFCDSFESGDTTGWSITSGVIGERSGPAGSASCLGEPEWSVRTSYAYRGGALLADYKAGDVRHYHLDHLGSVRQITNGERDVVASYNYLPYGEEVDSRYNPLQFTGHERDSHLAGGADDLDYMHARYYSPYLGRFLSVDPVRSKRPTAPQSWNKYSYVRGNPLKYKDPNGEDLRISYDFSESSLSEAQQAKIAQGIRTRFRNAGAQNVQNFFPQRRGTFLGTVGGPPKPTRPSDRNVTLRYQDAPIKGYPTALGKNSPPSTKAIVTTAHSPTGDVTQLINTGAHEAGHASRALRLYDNDNRVPRSILHPYPAEAGSIMEQGVSVNDLQKALREFSKKDAAMLRKELNPP